MLKVKTKVSQSTIPGAGQGLFATQFIPKGTVVWEFDPQLDITTEDMEIRKMSHINRQSFLIHAYYSKRMKLWIMCGDDAIYMNHNDSPNLMSQTTGKNSEDRDLAAIDINPGEEIFCNYYEFDEDANRKLKSL